MLDPVESHNQLHPKVLEALSLHPPPVLSENELRAFTTRLVDSQSGQVTCQVFGSSDTSSSPGVSLQPSPEKSIHSGIYRHKDLQLTFEGKLIEGVPHGWGKVVTRHGVYIEGHFEQGALVKYARIYDHDGTVYWGEIQARLKHGTGTFIDKMQQKIVGTWVHGKADGNITVTNKEGEVVFTGEVRSGYREGKGVFVDKKNKCTYSGEFSRDLYHGQGKLTFEKWKNL
mgnify:FL=1